MELRHGWLFPTMVVAAGSVIVFGCVGIAAITGYIPLSKSGPNPLGGYAIPSDITVPAELTTHRLAQVDAGTAAAPRHQSGVAVVAHPPVNRSASDRGQVDR
jgi:hypothetical protein